MSLFITAVPISEIGDINHAFVFSGGAWYEAKKDIQKKRWITTSGYLLPEPEFFFPIPNIPKYMLKKLINRNI